MTDESELRKLPTWGLYSEKMSGELVQLLEEKGLVRRTEGEWIEVEKTTAEQYMIYLAARIGNRLNSNPITDNTAQSNFPVISLGRHTRQKILLQVQTCYACWFLNLGRDSHV